MFIQIYIFRERVSHYTLDQIEAIAEFVQSKSPETKPNIGIICGTGLGGLADLVDSKTEIDYEDIHSFPRSTGKLYGTVAADTVSSQNLAD